MSEINANFVVQPFGITVAPEAPGITVSPTTTNLNVYSLGFAQPEGNVGELQFNLNGQVLGGAANTLVSNGNVRFTNISNLKINGGANAYFLQTDGVGNLTWAQGTANVSGNGTAAGANTQIQISDGTGNFTSGAGFTFDNVSNVFTAPGNAVIVGDVSANTFDGYAISTSNTANTIAARDTNGNLSANYFIGNGSQLTGIDTSAISNGNSNVRVFANANVTISSAGNANVVIVTGNSFTINGDQFFNGNGAWGAQNMQANYINANYVVGTLVTSNQPNITAVGTLSNLDVSGNVIASNVYANSGIIRAFNIQGNTGGFTGNVTANNIVSNLARGNSNISIFGNAGNIGMSVNGTANVVTISNDSMNVAGNITANYLFGNISGANANNANFANFAGNVTNAAQPNITSVGNLTSLSIAPNGNIQLSGSLSFISGADFISTTTLNANTVNANSVEGNTISTTNLGYFGTQIALSNSNLKIRTAATDRLDISNTLANFSVPVTSSNDITSSSNIIANNIQANTNITANANITANYFIGNGALLTGIDTTLISNGSANVRTFANANVTISAGGVANTVVAESNLITFWTDQDFNGNGAFGNHNLQLNYLNANFVIGTLTTANQPNITQVGTLTSLTVNGNATANFFLGDGGLLSNIPGAANGTSLISIPVANGNINLISNSVTTAIITSTGANIAGTLNVTGNANVGNLGTGGLITATGNVTGGNLITTGTLSVTGNANIGNINSTFVALTANLNANNVVAGNIISTGNANITGNITGGNANISGRLSVTGNANVGNIGANNAVFTTVSGNGTSLTNVTANFANITSEKTSANVHYITFVSNVGNNKTLLVDDSANTSGLYYYPDQADLRGGYLTFRTFRFGGQVIECNPNNESKITFWANAVANIMVITDTAVSVAKPLQLHSANAATVANITGAVGYMMAVSDQNGQLAYYNTGNTRWEYVANNAAV